MEATRILAAVLQWDEQLHWLLTASHFIVGYKCLFQTKPTIFPEVEIFLQPPRRLHLGKRLAILFSNPTPRTNNLHWQWLLARHTGTEKHSLDSLQLSAFRQWDF